MLRDDRAVTSPISYALTIAIATILITGLVVAASGHVSDQRTRTAHAQMDVVAQQVAANLEAADRLVRSTDDDPDLKLYRDLPDQILGTGYTVEVTDADVTVQSSLSERSVTVGHGSQTTVNPGSVTGGEISIEYASGDLVVNDE